MASIPSLLKEGINSAFDDGMTLVYSFDGIVLEGELNSEETAYVAEGELVRLFRAMRAANILSGKNLEDVTGKISDSTSSVSFIASQLVIVNKSDVLRPMLAQVLSTLIDPNIPLVGDSFTDDQIKENLGTAYLKFGPYMVFLYLYVPLAFVIGLFGFASPMTYSTIPICLALVTWLGIQISAIYYQKWDYLKGFTSPLPTWLPVFVPINILSKFSPLLSLSMRLLGNAVSGYILMYLVYWATGLASEAISGLAGANFIGVVIAPFLHAYFDAFGAFVQTTIFTTLTMLLIATEIPAPVNVDINKKSKKEIKKAQRALKKAQKA
jgi:F-type H+-transporting ATPase subunit a